MTQVYGIIGYPLGHSLSPYMHSRYAYYLNVDQEYRMFETNPEILQFTVDKLHKENVKGLNVTLPFKQDIRKYLLDIDAASLKIGAVNTLKYHENGYIGYNTDYLGLKISLNKAGIDISNKNILILGAGGAARAAAYIAAEGNCRSLTVLNRTFAHARKLCNDFGGKPLDYSMLDLLKCDYIVFQTTNVGMHPFSLDMLPLPETVYDKAIAAVDLIYNPLKTRFIEKFEMNGIKTVNGFDMLINQGLESRKIWNPNEIISNDIKKKVYDECISYKWS